MALTKVSDDFDKWLCDKLAKLDIDSDVYGSYITGILEEDDDAESKEEALEGILGSFVEDPTELCKEVLQKWKKPSSQNGLEKEPKQTMEDILAAHSAKINHEKSATGDKPTQITDSETKRALLAKYGEVYDEVDEDDPSEKTTAKSTKSVAPNVIGLFQNVNVKAVSEAEKMKRDKQKEESQKKKEKDKMDREKQKLKKEDRKEKEKKRTQKKEKMTR